MKATIDPRSQSNYLKRLQGLPLDELEPMAERTLLDYLACDNDHAFLDVRKFIAQETVAQAVRLYRDWGRALVIHRQLHESL